VSAECLKQASTHYPGTHAPPKTVRHQKIKVKESRSRSGVTQKVPEGLVSQIFMTFGTRKWWGSQPHAPATFTPRNVPGTHFY